MDILIAGASRGFGYSLAEYLSKNHTVRTIQRTPPKGLDLDWIRTDFSKPEQTVMAVDDLVSRKVKLDAVINCVHSPKVIEKWGSVYDFNDTINPSILEPLMMINLLIEYGVLSWGGHVVFLQDSRIFQRPNEVASAVKTAILQPMVRAFAASKFPSTLCFSFIKPRPKESIGSEFGLIEAVSKTLEASDSWGELIEV